jgi:D-glycero-D-manno-heptose 1,7-bisphosphate phosphatase
MCQHDDEPQCPCRKPKPGLITSAANDLKINLQKSFLVGDRWRDIAAGQAIGLLSYFVNRKYDEKQPSQPYIEVSSLLEAVLSVVGDLNENVQ